MAITVDFKYKGRSLTNDSAEIIYIARGTEAFVPSTPDPELSPEEQDDLWAQEEADHNATADVQVRDAVLAVANETHDEKSLDDVRVEEVADGVWYVTVTYAANEFTPGNGVTYSFEIGGATQHITQSISTVASYAAGGGTAPDFKGAINVSGGEAKGVDIHASAYAFTLRKTMPAADITDTYKGNVLSVHRKVNNGTFHGHAAGECLFIGATGTPNADGAYNMEFRFIGSGNKTGLSVGTITGIDKKGWEYLWVLYEDKDDTTAKKLVKQPIAAYVEQVYESANFALLGVGT